MESYNPKKTVKTELGTLEARVKDDPKYPGISVGLNRDGAWIEYGWVEVDQSEEDNPILKVHVFNSFDDEPIYDFEETQYVVDKMFASMKEAQEAEAASAS